LRTNLSLIPRNVAVSFTLKSILSIVVSLLKTVEKLNRRQNHKALFYGGIEFYSQKHRFLTNWKMFFISACASAEK
jgi:hypothetical protein